MPHALPNSGAARFDMRFVFRSPAFFVLLAIGVFNAFGSLRTIIDVRGVQFFPVTRAVVDALSGSFSMIPTIIAIYYAGELVWRDRQMRMHDIVDATAAPAWSHLVPKVLAIALVPLASYPGRLVPDLHGISDRARRLPALVQLGHVRRSAGGPVGVRPVAGAAQVRWAVLVYVVASVNNIGFGYNRRRPQVPLSDMNGMGRFWIARAWFHAYWLAFALMLMVVAHVMWPRGVERGSDRAWRE
jgi:hypothetical protein